MSTKLKMKQQFEEVQKRHEKLNNTRKTTLIDPYFKYKPFPNKNQTHVVIQIGHENQIPITASAQPVYRICGAFGSAELAKAHAQNVAEHTKCNTYVVKSHGPHVLCRSSNAQIDLNYQDKTVYKRIMEHQQFNVFRRDEFINNVKKKQTGSTTLKMQKKNAIDKKKTIKLKNYYKKLKLKHKKIIQSKKYTEAPTIPPTLGNINQQFAAISVLKDRSPEVISKLKSPEPAVIFWQAFPSENIGKDWIRKNQNKVKNHTIGLVVMYEFHYIANESKSDPIEYGNSDLNSIVQHNANKLNEIEEYKNTCHEQNMPINFIDVYPTKSTKASDITDLPTNHMNVKLGDSNKTEDGFAKNVHETSLSFKKYDDESDEKFNLKKPKNLLDRH